MKTGQPVGNHCLYFKKIQFRQWVSHGQRGDLFPLAHVGKRLKIIFTSALPPQTHSQAV